MSKIIFIWANFGPYHIDRLEAAAKYMPNNNVTGIEIAAGSTTYEWARPKLPKNADWITLFPNQVCESVSPLRTLIALIAASRKVRAKHVFLCNYDRPAIFLFALWLWLTGRRCYNMFESKFDDKRRNIWHEAIKQIAQLPYRGCLVGGARIGDYARFISGRSLAIAYGYDTISVDRIRRLAGSPAAPAGVAYSDRHFTVVARFVAVKNLPMALDAYAQYRILAGQNARELHLCGSGQLEAELRSKARTLGVDHFVKFRGFLQEEGIAQALANSLALILPSTTEPWGLVVNEALAMGLPILCSDNVGARDLLVRTGVNGFVFEPDNAEGLARLMYRLATDQVEWERLAQKSASLAGLGDAKNFADGVRRLIDGPISRDSKF
jgi:glycosyltransferase involved in cell wall biosynthesis